MKKRSQAAWVVSVGLVFLVALLVLRINVSTVSRLSVTTSPPSLTETGQGTKRLLLRGITRAPLDSQSQSPESRVAAAAAITCNRSHYAYDTCTVHGPTLLHPPTHTFFLLRAPNAAALLRLPPEKIRPHPRKWENFTMSKIKEFTLAAAGPPEDLRCDVEHDAPALVLSVGGYTGNFFHEFNDGLVPLFVTANTVFPGRDFVLVIDGATDQWVRKFEDLLRALSDRPVVNLNRVNGSHCFPSASVGLISHGFMTINPKLTPNSRTFLDFHQFLDEAYGRNRPEAPRAPARRPRLVITARTGGVGRVILNQKEVTDLAAAVGFEVVVFEPKRSTPLREAYELIKSSHALVGVHGAALTHTLFLRPGAVLGQVVPIGAGWVARVCFENPARAMGLSYVEYGIAAEESSLVEKYGRHDVLLKDPAAANGGGWSAEVMKVYLKEQDVRLDLARFKGFLEEVYEKAKKFMEEEGKG